MTLRRPSRAWCAHSTEGHVHVEVDGSGDGAVVLERCLQHGERPDGEGKGRGGLGA